MKNSCVIISTYTNYLSYTTPTGYYTSERVPVLNTIDIYFIIGRYTLLYYNIYILTAVGFGDCLHELFSYA